MAALLALGVVALAAPPKRPATPAASKATAPVRQPSDAELIRRRAAWFYDQRAFPLGFIPAGARLRALEQLRQMKAAQQQTRQFQTFGTAAAGDPPWAAFGPQPSTSPDFQPFVSGRVTALAVDPTNPNIVYLGAAEGGVWKTTDGGATWTPMTDAQPSLAVGSIAIDPSSCSPGPCTTIYVGTGEENFAIDNYYGAGVLKSTTGGTPTSWTQLGASTFAGPFGSQEHNGGAFIGGLAVAGGTILAAVRFFQNDAMSGIYRSTDGGVTWSSPPVLPGAAGTDVVFDPTNSMVAYAGLGSAAGNAGNGIYKSTNAGMTWTKLSLSPPGGSTFGRIALGIGPGELFAAIADGTSDSTDLLGVFKTTNGGTTWTQLTDPLTQPAMGFCEFQCFYDLVIRVDPANANVVFAGGAATPPFGGYATLIRSLDGGSTWAEVSNNSTSLTGIHVDMHAIAFSSNGGVLYVGNDGGVWNTTSPAGAIGWSNLNKTLGTLQFYPGLSVHPSNPAFRSFGGTQDNGLQRYMGGVTGNLLQWDDTGTLGDGGFTAIDPNFPSSIFAVSEYVPGSFLAIIKSTQNGDGIATSSTFNCIAGLAIGCPATGITITDNGNFIPPFAIDPNSTTAAERVYFGTFQLYQSVDGGNTWSSISPDLTSGCTGNGIDCLSAIAVAPGNSNTIYTGAGNGQVRVSTNALAAPGSATWTNVTGTLPPRAVTAVAVDPANPMTAYVTFSGFSSCTACDHLGHVFQTTTGGTAWVDITGTLPPTGSGLPDIPVNDVVIDPDVPNTLYVATDIGVFVTSNANTGTATTWAQLSTGLPKVAVLSLKLDRAARQLFAATHGRSVWEFQLTQPAFSLATINPASASVGGTVFTMTLTGTGFTSNSKVQFNGSQTGITTTFRSAMQLTATIPASDLASGGAAPITVFDSTQTPNTTNALVFTVLNPAPTVTSITPSTATAPAGSNLTLTINGTNFNSGSTVQLAQTAPTTLTLTSVSFNSSTQLTATIPQSALQFGGTFVVVVNNPQPGGGSSCPNPDPFACPTSNLLVVTAALPPPNDNIANAAIVGSSPYSSIVDSSAATVESTDPSLLGLACVLGDNPPPAQNGDAKSVWYKATAGTGGGTIEADTIGSTYDTILTVWTGMPGNLLNVTCNDDINPGVNRLSQLTFPATAGTTYFFLVSAFEGDGGKTVFNLTGNVVPSVNYMSSVSPTMATVKAGQSTSPPIMVTLTPAASSPGGTVALSCSGLPAKSSCSFSPSNMVMLSPSPPVTAVTVMLTISTTANSTLFPSPPGPATRLPLYAPWLSLAVLALLFSLWVSQRSPRKGIAFGFAGVLLLVALAVFQVSCAGGGGKTTPTSVSGTPPGTYSVAIVGSPSSSGGGQLQNPTVTLAVTP